MVPLPAHSWLADWLTGSARSGSNGFVRTRISGFLAVLVLVAVGAVTAADAATTSAAATTAVRPVISPPSAFAAPIGERGGVMSPFVRCTDDAVAPRVRWTIAGEGIRRTFRWVGAYPGMAFPRLPVGDYRSVTTATCRGTTVRRVTAEEIVEKTERGTVSRREFNAVRRGMTLAEVRDVVGNWGRDPFRYRGVVSRTFDNMEFWSWSIIEFRRGVVARKFWDVGHD